MTPALIIVGALACYRPDTTPGELACGGQYKWDDYHIAIRQWRTVGCGAIAKVCVDVQRDADGNHDGRMGVVRGVRGRKHGAGAALARTTRRCVYTEVRDSGPWAAWRNGRREVQIKLKPGWKRRTHVDLSYALWVALGRPRFLSKVRVEIYRR